MKDICKRYYLGGGKIRKQDSRASRMVMVDGEYEKFGGGEEGSQADCMSVCRGRLVQYNRGDNCRIIRSGSLAGQDGLRPIR